MMHDYFSIFFYRVFFTRVFKLFLDFLILNLEFRRISLLKGLLDNVLVNGVELNIELTIRVSVGMKLVLFDDI